MFIVSGKALQNDGVGFSFDRCFLLLMRYVRYVCCSGSSGRSGSSGSNGSSGSGSGRASFGYKFQS
jgi:hypothetical protein